MGFAIPLALAAFPETMGAIGLTAATAGTASGIIGAVGTGLSALGSITSGQAASKSAKYNAAVAANNAQTAQNNATLAGQEGAANANIEQQKTRANVGEIKAAQAANGVNVNKGSAVDVQSSAAELGELNAINIRSNAARSAYGYQTQAASDKAQSELDKQEASFDSTAGLEKAGTTLLGNSTEGSQSGLWGNWLKQGSL